MRGRGGDEECEFESTRGILEASEGVGSLVVEKFSLEIGLDGEQKKKKKRRTNEVVADKESCWKANKDERNSRETREESSFLVL